MNERNGEGLLSYCIPPNEVSLTSTTLLPLLIESQEINVQRALIWYWDHLKNFIAEIPQGPLGMSIGTIWMTQKRSQGPPARGF